MKIEALNCPNCGAGVSSDKSQCEFCFSRLKTVACTSCLGLMFLGSKHCSRCGKETIGVAETVSESPGDCPRCKIALNMLRINEIELRECRECGGLWSDIRTFEGICSEREHQASVLGFIREKGHPPQTVIQYVPCPDCKKLMNRNNFARTSGVIVDICKEHGLWFDADELSKIIQFIRDGGVDRARQNEIVQLQEKKRELADRERKIEVENRRFANSKTSWQSSSPLSISDFIDSLFD